MQGGNGNAVMAGILERLMSREEGSNLTLPPSLLGDAAPARPLACAAASRLGPSTTAGPAAGSSPPATLAAAGGAAAIGKGADAGGGGGDLDVGGAFASSLLGCVGLSQLEMDVGSLLGLGDGGGSDSWDAPACCGGCDSSGASAGSASGSQGCGLKPFHQLFPSSEVKA